MQIGRHYRAALSSIVALILSCISLVAQPSFSVTEDFGENPLKRGWNIFGDTNLFIWNQEQQHLEVTWDSARPNSYFWFPLPRLLSRADSFSISLDLMVSDYAAGVSPEKNGAMQIAFGFQNQADAQGPTFYRGAATNTPNLAEFNFFPDTGFGPTISPAVLSTNSSLNYNGPGDFTIADIPTGVVMRVTFAYSGTNETASITILTNGVLAVPVTAARLSTNSSPFSPPFSDFAVDSFAIASYSEEGQDPQYAGSLLAHAIVDNISLAVEAGPVTGFKGEYSDGRWAGSFSSREGWAYQLEASSDLTSWVAMGDGIAGTGGNLQLFDDNATTEHRFYRVVARRTN